MNEHQQVVQAEQFQVVDREGRPRMVLGIKDETPSFELLRQDGSIGVSISFDSGETPNILLRDRQGRIKANIRLYDDQGLGDGEYPSISVKGYDGRSFAYMTAAPYDYGELGLMDENGRPVVLRHSRP